METEMPQQVVMGAQLQCSQGMSPANLLVLPLNRVQSSFMPAANIMDHFPILNIPPFGMCQCPMNPMVIAATAAAMGTPTPAPCIPMTFSPWTPGAPQTQIAFQPALDDTSQCLCMWGGQITVTAPGQTTEAID
jgi:hypothetical protein